MKKLIVFIIACTMVLFSTPVYANIVGETGAYNTPGYSDPMTNPSRAMQFGLTIGTAPYLMDKSVGSSAATVIEDSGIEIIDTTPKNILYSNHASLDTCDEKIAKMKSVQAPSSVVQGFVLTDDFISVGGPSVPCIRRMADILNKPTVCPIQLDVPTDQRSGASILDKFKNQWSNYYRSGYCSWVGFYSYVRRGETNPRWEMNWLFKNAKNYLYAEGWNGRLIGMPQAFGDTQNHPETTEYYMPSKADVVEQTRAFCTQGATTLLAFGWTDAYASEGRQNLSNNQALLDGYKSGALCL